MEKMTIRELRRAREFSQESMAELLGVHVNTYRGYEEHPERIPISKAAEIAKILDVDMSRIIFLPRKSTVM